MKEPCLSSALRIPISSRKNSAEPANLAPTQQPVNAREDTNTKTAQLAVRDYLPQLLDRRDLSRGYLRALGIIFETFPQFSPVTSFISSRSLRGFIFDLTEDASISS